MATQSRFRTQPHVALGSLLPPELINHILTYVQQGNQRDIAILARVNKYWYSVCTNLLWAKIYPLQQADINKFGIAFDHVEPLRHQHYANKVRQLHITERVQESMACLVRDGISFPRLESLKIKAQYNVPDGTIVSPYIVPTLTEFAIDGSTNEDILSLLQNSSAALRVLKLNTRVTNSSTNLLALLKAKPSIEKFCLGYQSDALLDKAAFEHLAYHHSNLRIMKVKRYNNNEAEMGYLVEPFAHLERLELGAKFKVLKAVLPSNLSLRGLSFNVCERYNNSIPAGLDIQRFQRLEVLDLGQLQVEKSELLGLHRFNCLQKLKVKTILEEPITEDEGVTLLSSWPKMVKLSITNCTGIANHAMLALARSSPYLTHAELYNGELDLLALMEDRQLELPLFSRLEILDITVHPPGNRTDTLGNLNHHRGLGPQLATFLHNYMPRYGGPRDYGECHGKWPFESRVWQDTREELRHLKRLQVMKGDMTMADYRAMFMVRNCYCVGAPEVEDEDVEGEWSSQADVCVTEEEIEVCEKWYI